MLMCRPTALKTPTIGEDVHEETYRVMQKVKPASCCQSYSEITLSAITLAIGRPKYFLANDEKGLDWINFPRHEAA